MNPSSLLRSLPSTEPRPGQFQLVNAIHESMTKSESLLAEGPCGIGKSIAYLIPAILSAQRGERTLIVTSSIALQEQLITKDIPFLSKHIGIPFTYGILKGRGNYVCNDALARLDLFSLDNKEVNHSRMMEENPSGDKSTFRFVPSERLWSRVTVDADECKSEECGYYEECFHRLARKRAWNKDIVVTNYHLLFADMAGREVGMNPVLPDVEHIVCDEAHELADIAREFLGGTVTSGIGKRMAEWEKTERSKKKHREIEVATEKAFLQLEKLVANATPSAYRNSKSTLHIDKPMPELVFMKPVLDSLESMRDHAEKVFASSDGERKAKARTAFRKFSKSHAWLKAAVNYEDSSMACWLELDKHGVRVESRHVNVAPLLRTMLWPRFKSATLVSATMTISDSFQFVKGEVGFPKDCKEIAVKSPFDFKKNCIVLTPRIVDPNHANWSNECANVLSQVIRVMDGRTLALFTSRANRDHVFAVCSQRYADGREWLRQGEDSTRELVDKFRKDTRSVLFGTKSFWTGVDVPGESLSAVVIDRMPFAAKDDPVMRKLRMLSGERAFQLQDLPRAIVKLRQGFGRLIRRASDCGVVVLLDSRLQTSRWSSEVWRSLPVTATARTMEEVAEFLGRV